jgi:hypothetical protein
LKIFFVTENRKVTADSHSAFNIRKKAEKWLKFGLMAKTEPPPYTHPEDPSPFIDTPLWRTMTPKVL